MRGSPLSPQIGRCSNNSRIASQITVFYLCGFASLIAVCVLTNGRLFNAQSFSARGWLDIYPLLLVSTYSAMYLLPALALSVVAALAARGKRSAAIVAGVSVVASTAVAALLYSDLNLYALYNFHLNAFVWNLITTPGGLASLGFDQMSVASVAIALSSVVVAALLCWYLAGVAARRWTVRWGPLLAAFMLLTLSERAIYAVNHFFANGRIVDLAASFPLYQPATASGLMKGLGYRRNQTDVVRLKTLAGDDINYPLTPLVVNRTVAPPNIMMLVVESLRADMLTPEIMPNLWGFSAGALRFADHYSGGNGTRQGLFALFYGLYGNNWDRFLHHRRSPALFGVLAQHNYQRLALTSASFTYPEFDQTIFADFKPEELGVDAAGQSWARDVRNVDRLLASLATPPMGRPWFRFMFFESTHARYSFPEAAAIRPDYLKTVDYTKLTPGFLTDNIARFKNRYVNAAHHVDAQIGRVLDAFVAAGMAENTVLIVTGDHGEAFMEKGRWGHNSDFSEEQVRVPLVVSIPGRPPAVIEHVTSHLDVAPTLLPLLGIDAPAHQYSAGTHLLADTGRLVVVSSWNDIGIITDRAKIVVPFGSTTQHTNLLTSRDDQRLRNASLGEFLPLVKTVLAQANRFSGRPGQRVPTPAVAALPVATLPVVPLPAPGQAARIP